MKKRSKSKAKKRTHRCPKCGTRYTYGKDYVDEWSNERMKPGSACVCGACGTPYTA